MRDGDKKRIQFSLKLAEMTGESDTNKAKITFMQNRIATISFMAAIEVVAKDKSPAVESALQLNGVLGLLASYSVGEKRNYLLDESVKFAVSRSNDDISLTISKISSEDK